MSSTTVKNVLKVANLEDLLHPFTAKHFIENYLEKKPLIINRKDSDFYKSLFSIEQVDRVLDVSRPRGNSLRVVKNQEPLLPTKYENQDGSLNLNQLYAAYADGYTMVINEMERFWQPLKALCQNISSVLSHRTVSNMYLTPKQEKALLPHYDTHDVYVLQIYGKKNWIIYDTATESPLLNSHQPIFKREQLSNPQELTLEAGDLMYMPRGLPHEAYTTDESSLHITIGVYPAQWIDLLSKAMEQMALKDVDLRRALPAGYLNAENWTKEFVEEFTTKFQEQFNKVAKQGNISEGIFSLAEEFRNKQAPQASGHFQAIDRIGQLDLDTYLEKREGMQCSIQVQGPFSRIIFPGNVIKGPALIAEALQYIADARGKFQLKDLPAISDDNKIQLAARLIRGGLLQFAD